MPELPEVETIRRDLEDYLSLPSQITSFTIYDQDFFRKHSNIENGAHVTGATINEVDRHGKKLIFVLDQGFLVFHLGMSGQIISSLENTKYPEHVKLHFRIGNKDLFYVDVRKFGNIRFFAKNEKEQIYQGIDPVKEGVDIDVLKKICQSARPVKSILMEQKQLVGIGNIYANEILFCAGILPHRKAETLTLNEIREIRSCIEKILSSAIENFGTTFSIYRNLKGREGKNSDFLKVYGRHGLKCLVCGTEINKIVIQQRSTFFCPRCQK